MVQIEVSDDSEASWRSGLSTFAAIEHSPLSTGDIGTGQDSLIFKVGAQDQTIKQFLRRAIDAQYDIGPELCKIVAQFIATAGSLGQLSPPPSMATIPRSVASWIAWAQEVFRIVAPDLDQWEIDSAWSYGWDQKKPRGEYGELGDNPQVRLEDHLVCALYSAQNWNTAMSICYGVQAALCACTGNQANPARGLVKGVLAKFNASDFAETLAREAGSIRWRVAGCGNFTARSYADLFLQALGSPGTMVVSNEYLAEVESHLRRLLPN